MSDAKSPAGEPVEEPTNVEDVARDAEASLADAAAAAELDPAIYGTIDEDFVVADVADEPVVVDTEVQTDAAGDVVAAEASVATPTEVVTETATAPSENLWDRPRDNEPTAVISETVVETPAYAPTQQPIFVQAPEPPIPHGNRAFAGLVGLLAAVVFAALYLGAALGFGALDGEVTGDNVGEVARTIAMSWGLWVPTAIFFIAFWLLGAIINRGPWAAWVIFGLLVGVASWGGHILGKLFEAPFWLISATQGAAIAEAELLAPASIASFIIGRELTIWFGAWVARRGKRMTELNIEDRREYERTLEAGPQLYQQ